MCHTFVNQVNSLCLIKENVCSGLDLGMCKKWLSFGPSHKIPLRSIKVWGWKKLHVQIIILIRATNEMFIKITWNVSINAWRAS